MMYKISGYKPRVLVIEDDESIVEVFRTMLSGPPDTASPAALAQLKKLMKSRESSFAMHEFRVDAASQGEDGYELVKKAIDDGDPYSVIFIDVRMPPGWHGVKTATEIRMIDLYVNIIINTAFSDFSTCQIADHVGTIERLFFVKKPFHYETIIQFADTLALSWSEERKLRLKLNVLEKKEKKLLARIHELERSV